MKNIIALALIALPLAVIAQDPQKPVCNPKNPSKCGYDLNPTRSQDLLRVLKVR